MTKKKRLIIILVLILIIGSGLGIWYFCTHRNAQPENVVEVVDSIKNFDYVLEDRDTPIYKEAFSKLKSILESDTINYEEYARYLGELYLIDLYTISNKVNKYDVGALDFIYPSEKEKFQNIVMDTLYKFVEDNSTNSRNQSLPEVTNVEISDLENTTYKIQDNDLEAYLIHATISYKEDLGYDSKVKIIVVKDDNKLYVVNSEKEDL